ncbi:hypothetical protein BCV71DRAFT_233638 [Rhizopus microsporus]|uniref:Uncharacterized protein n=1 Tax=Rhizopus microsporus TaxID=58291 RepID=A0A1X0S6Y6_RHIZD|nr:hypothetical protein BCV71DRAFT_233638 [Rhizopus microsporus]
MCSANSKTQNFESGNHLSTNRQSFLARKRTIFTSCTVSSLTVVAAVVVLFGAFSGLKAAMAISEKKVCFEFNVKISTKHSTGLHSQKFTSSLLAAFFVRQSDAILLQSTSGKLVQVFQICRHL